MTNNLGLTPLTLAAYLARMDMFFHIASIERDVYWQLGNITCSAYPLRGGSNQFKSKSSFIY